MSNREFSRFPWYSPKRIFGSMPHWYKRWRNKKIRKDARDSLRNEEEPSLRYRADDRWM